MAKFKYTAVDTKGQASSGEVEADSQTQALTRIREKGLYPTEVGEVSARTVKRAAAKAAGPVGGAPAAKGKGMQMELKLPSFLVRVGAKQLMTFTRQLATLIDAGLPLLRGLQVLLRQEKNQALRNALKNMAEAIETGSTFAEALGQQPRIFNKLFISMVRAGELGGVLDVVLLRLAEFMEKAQRIKNKVVSAMIYPVVVLVMAGGILTFLMVGIVPKFQEIFTGLLEGASLPPLTQFVMNASKLMSTKLPMVAGGIVVLVLLVKILKKTAFGSALVDRLKLNMPLFGSLLRKTAIARFSRTLGTLMSSGVPVLQALLIVRDTVGNEVLGRGITQIHDSVKEGENMATPIASCGIFPPMVVSMVEVGEETGKLPEMLMKIADNYDDEVDNAVAGLTSVIEPILIIFLALVVGTIVIALFMPLISIIGKLSTG